MPSEEKGSLFKDLVGCLPWPLLVLNAGGKVEAASPAMERLLNIPSGQLSGKTLHEFMHPDDVPALSENILALQMGARSTDPYRLRLRDSRSGAWLSVTSLAHLLKGEMDSLVFAFGKIESFEFTETGGTSNISLQTLFDGLAGGVPEGGTSEPDENPSTHFDLFLSRFFDPLTRLPGRELLVASLTRSWKANRSGGSGTCALVLIDIDRFRVVNDGLGHQAGDRLLFSLARRLEKCLGPQDSLARVTGDRFAILLEGSPDSRRASATAAAVQEQMKKPFKICEAEVYASTSIGVALGSPGHSQPEDILLDAEAALRRAKSTGKARHVVFENSMRAGSSQLLEMEMELRKASDKQAFRVHYQPIVAMQSGTIAGFEALIRWPHPKLGLIPPGKFISLAEDTGLIVPIGRWIMRESCRQLQAWQKKFPQTPPLVVSVNLSGIQLMQADLVMQIDLALRECGLSGHSVKVELTESILMEHAEYAEAMLKQMKALSLTICLDDFGTGYSSMSYLKKYPIDTVKIDQSFVRKMVEDDESLEIVRSIVGMAHNLGMDVIAEGVETHHELQRLRALKCEYGQGYFFAKPLPTEEAEALLAKKWYW